MLVCLQEYSQELVDDSEIEVALVKFRVMPEDGSNAAAVTVKGEFEMVDLVQALRARVTIWGSKMPFGTYGAGAAEEAVDIVVKTFAEEVKLAVHIKHRVMDQADPTIPTPTCSRSSTSLAGSWRTGMPDGGSGGQACE